MLKFELNIPIDISLCVSIRNNKNPIIGIYKITSPTGCINIGQAIDIENRFSYYKRLACEGQPRLYNSLKKYSIKNHTFEIIHLCSEEELNYWEDFYVKKFDTFNTPKGLNLKEGGGARGRLSDESKNKLSKSQKERFKFISYEEAKKWIKENELTKNIKTSNEWSKIRNKLPIYIPKSPLTTYKNEGWKGWGDFLGTGRKYRGDFINYEEAKKWIRENELTKNIKTQKEWKKIIHKLPPFITKNPQGYYLKTKEWKSWSDFLRSYHIATQYREYLSYNESKKWVQENKLTKNIKSRNEWKEITNKLPLFIPKDSEGVYRRQGKWQGWGDFLGTGFISNKNRIFYDYEKCKKWIKDNNQTKNIKTQKDWEKFYRHKLPSFIPKDPPSYYRKQGVWKGWGDFLGTGNKNKGDFLSYEVAKKWLMKNPFTKNLKSKKEWCDIKSKLPSFIPKSPDFVYKNKGWKGWSSFLNK